MQLIDFVRFLTRETTFKTSCFFSWTIGPEVIKRFYMLNSAEHEFCPANKSQILSTTNSFLLNIAEHDIFSANKYENANWHFHIY